MSLGQGTAANRTDKFIVRNSTFERNLAAQGGAMDVAAVHGRMLVSDSTFVGNQANLGGAVVVYDSCMPQFVRSNFTKNVAVQ